MAAIERLKDDRALQIPIAQPRKLNLVTQDDRELPTAPENLKPSAPPSSSPFANEVAGLQIPPPARLPGDMVRFPSERPEPAGFDPDKWEHYKIARMVESLDVVRAGLKALSPLEQEKLITKVAESVASRFRPIVEASEARVMGEVRTLGREQSRTNDDMSDLRIEMNKLRADFERRMSLLEDKQRAQEGIKNVVAQPAEAPAKLDPAPGG